jgi:ribonucleoside-diphosphate reductase alpha chain
LKYFGGDELAATTWMNKYAVRDKEGHYLESTPNDMHRRMAEEFARIESSHRSAAQLNGSFSSLSSYGQERQPLDAQQIFNYFKDFKYVIPQGSVMASLGNKEVLASLSNCVVMPSPVDSYGGVFRTDATL